MSRRPRRREASISLSLPALVAGSRALTRVSTFSIALGGLREYIHLMTNTTTLTGHDAIEYAAAHGLTLSKHADPTEPALDGMTVEEARDVAAQDPSLVYLTTDAVARRRTLGWMTLDDARRWAREGLDTTCGAEQDRERIPEWSEDLAAEAWAAGEEMDVLAWVTERLATDTYAAIGSDGTRLVVWGLGETEEDAEQDARDEAALGITVR
jgi:hypothetical protein